MDTQYENLLRNTLNNGAERNDRTGVGTLSLFGTQLRYNLTESFPLITTKKVHLRSIVEELIWFLNGETNVKPLQEKGVKIWNEWSDENGELGPVYGKQWRSWPAYGGRHEGEIDQIRDLIDSLVNNPNSRRHIVTAWNPSELDKMALPPCHMTFQCYVARDTLSLSMYQRSADLALGLPFDIASYALLTHMLAQQTGYQVGDLIISLGDVHIYKNHIDGVKEQLERTPFEFPQLNLDKADSIDQYKYEDVHLIDYKCHPAIKFPIAV